MHERQTKENLAKVILQELNTFGIDIEQIFAVAHDNGANMCASVRLLKSLSHPVSCEEVSLSSMLPKEFKMLDEYDHEDLLQTDSVEDTFNEETDDTETGDFTENITEQNEDQDDFVNGQDGTADFSIYDDGIEEFEFLNSIRCGAHTAQLVANDVIKLYKSRLSRINKKCLAMHRKTNRELFILHKIPLPPKVTETRWGVWYILLRYLQVLGTKPFLAILQSQDPTLSKY